MKRSMRLFDLGFSITSIGSAFGICAMLWGASDLLVAAAFFICVGAALVAVSPADWHEPRPHDRRQHQVRW